MTKCFIRGFFFLFTFISLLLSCKSSSVDHSQSELLSEIKVWDSVRMNNLRTAYGWPSVVGLYWLREGENTFGSGEENDIVFPEKVPNVMGIFVLKDSIVSMEMSDQYKVDIEGRQQQRYQMIDDNHENTTYSYWESLRWNVIKRQDQYGIRLYDTLSTARQSLLHSHIDRYPVSLEWVKDAKFSKPQEHHVLKFRNAVGMDFEEKPIGVLTFDHLGKSYELMATDGGEGEYFVVIGDQSSGDETYGGGRYLYVPGADSLQNCIIDFNKAYNPPCVFTDFATCPLPAAENILPFKVEAGEKNFGH